MRGTPGGFGVRVGFGAVLISIHSNFAKEKFFMLELPLKTLKPDWRGAAQNFGKRGIQNCRRDTFCIFEHGNPLWFIGASKSLYPNEQIQEISTTLGREYTALQNGNRTLIKSIIMTLCSFGAGSGSAARVRIRVRDQKRKMRRTHATSDPDTDPDPKTL